MSKKDATGRLKGHGRYIALRHWVVDSPAWHSLSADDAERRERDMRRELDRIRARMRDADRELGR